MKTLGLVIGIALLISLVFSATVLARIEFERESTKFNYAVAANDMIYLVDPRNSGNQAPLVALAQLPFECWNQSKWKEGEWGRIALLKGKCRVDQKASWGPGDMPTR